MRNAEERKAENKKLIEFLSEKCEEAEEPLNLNKLFDEFIKKEEIKTPRSTLHSVVEVYRKKEILEIENRETMVRRLFCLGAKINNDVLEKLEEDAKVELDGKGRIIKYESNDGQLTLNGNHCVTKKIRETMEKQRRSRMIAEDEVGNEDMELEVHPPAPKKARVEEPGSAVQVRDQILEEVENIEVKIEDAEVQEDIKPEFSEPIGEGNHLDPNLEMVKQEVPEPEDFQVKIENPEATVTNSASGPVRSEQPALPEMNSATPRQIRPSAPVVRPQNGPDAAPASSSTTQPPAPTAPGAARILETQTTVSRSSTDSGSQNLPRGQTPNPVMRATLNSAPAPVLETRNPPPSLPKTPGPSSSTEPPAPRVSGSQNLPRGKTPYPVMRAPLNSAPAPVHVTQNAPGPTSSTEPPAPIGVSTVTAPEQSAAPTENFQHQEQQPQTNAAPRKPPMLTNATQLEILKSLEAIIGIMDLPMDSSEIRNQIQKLTPTGGGENEIEMDDMKKTIDYSIVVAKMNRKSEGETRSLKDFLKLVQFTVVKDRFEQVQKELKEELEILKKNDKLVPVSNITMAVEVILRILVSN